METWELLCSIAPSTVVTAGRRLVGDEAVGEPTGSTTAGSRVRFGGQGEEGLTGAVPP
jgi:hypothetical protein